MGGQALERTSNPIFVVGASRSGTNLVRALLSRHSRLWISGETHYFDDLRPRLPGRGREPLTGQRRSECERYFLAQGHRAYGRGGDPTHSRIEPGELRDFAQALGGTGDAYFEAFCMLRARFHGKQEWGEKTPRHVYRIADILEAFPEARVVCLVRDPRAVVVSYRDWHKAGTRSTPDAEDAAALSAERERSRRSYNIILISLLWRAVTRAEQVAQAQFGADRVNLLRFEQLALDPEATTRALCDWLSIRYEPAMLEIPVVNSSYVSSGAAEGPSKDPVDRWHTTLSPREVAIVQRCCRTAMSDLGYPPAPAHVSLARYALALAGAPAATVRAALAHRGRMGRTIEFVRRRGGMAFARRPTDSRA